MENIEIIVRALIVRNRKILFCMTEGRDYFFLPGGHVEFNETLKDALRRELYEEMGGILKKTQFIGGIENIFDQEGVKKHEISFLFITDVDLAEIKSREAHLSFYWVDIENLTKIKIAPPALRDVIFQWIAEKEPFFIEERKDK